MWKCKSWIVMALVSACAVGAARAEDQPAASKPATQPAQDAAPQSPELALRIAALAQDTLHQQKVILPQHFKQAAGLLMAAMRLDPSQPRYARMLYEAMLKLQDDDGALAAITSYRGTNQETANDQLAMVQYLDLKANKLDTAKERLEFYAQFIDSAAPEPVRSHVAFRAYQLARERGDSDLQDTYLEKALQLNPVNLQALRAKLDSLKEDGTADERVGVLLSMLLSNPVQPMVSYRLAREIAETGQPQEALRFYTLTVELANATGTPMGREFAISYGSNLYLTGTPQLITYSKAIADGLLKQDPGDVETILLRWLAERSMGDKEAVAKSQQQIVNAALNRLMVLRQKMGAAGPGAATRPVDTAGPLPIPDLAEDIEKLKDEKLESVRLIYAQAVADLAWYLVYVANQPAEAAKLLPTLKAILSDKHPQVVRIEGWIFLAQNQNDQAGVKLKAVADQDVLAQAGNLMLWAKNPADKAAAADAAGKLLQDHPASLLGAILADLFKDLGVKLTPNASAAAIKKRLDAFPAGWLDVLGQPSKFYILAAGMDGGAIKFAFGEPIIARVYIKNISKFDITIGPEGVIQNDLWFDAQLRGLLQQKVSGAAYERITQSIVLKPGQMISQTVRLDQGQFTQVLYQNPSAAITFYGRVRTNPVNEGGSSPCGYEANFNSITERVGFPLDQNSMKNLNAVLAGGKPDEKLRSLELVGAQIDQLRGQPEQSDQVRAFVNALMDLVDKSQGDPAFSVTTWASFLTAFNNQNKRQAIIERFISDPEPSRRVLGLLLAQFFPPDQQKQLLTKVLETDKEEMVRLYASGRLEILKAEMAATTQPSVSGTAPGGTTPPTEGASPTPALINPTGADAGVGK